MSSLKYLDPAPPAADPKPPRRNDGGPHIAVRQPDARAGLNAMEHAAADLLFLARQAVRDCPHLTTVDVRVDQSPTAIVLRGRVNSYFQKQLAQEAVLRLKGVGQVQNQLCVRGNGSC